MKWLYNRQYMKNDDKIINGNKITLLSVFHFISLYSTHKGQHFSLGFGIGPFEIAIQLSHWVRDIKPMWENTHVGKS